MRIEQIDTYSTNMMCLVRVRDTDGAEGWGMTAPFSANISALVLHQLVAPLCWGEIDDYTTLADEIIREQYKYMGSFVARSVAGVDAALWDLMAKRAGKSVAGLLGGTRRVIDLYESSMKRDLPVQEEADRLRGIQEQFGYRAIKLHPGIPVGRDRDFWPGRTEDMVRAMVKTARPGTDIFVDVNGNYSVDKAVEMGKFLKDQGVVFFEEPCPYWIIEDTKAVRERLQGIGLPIAGGEQDYSDTMWYRMIDQRVMDICQPDLLYCGGFSRALRIAEYAARAGLQVTPHTSNQSPLLLMGLHYMAAIQTPYPYLECGIELQPWEKSCYHSDVVIQDGRAEVPTTPGWGWEPDECFLKTAVHQVSRAGER